MHRQDNHGNYHKRNNWILWTGKEVERNSDLIGEKTLFVGDALNKDLTNDIYSNYQHVFFNPIFITKNNFSKINEIVDNGIKVTISVTPQQIKLIPEDLFKKVNIMLCIEILGIDLENFKKSDSIKLQFGNMLNNNMSNLTFLISDGKFSSNEDYEEDVKIK